MGNPPVAMNIEEIKRNPMKKALKSSSLVHSAIINHIPDKALLSLPPIKKVMSLIAYPEGRDFIRQLILLVKNTNLAISRKCWEKIVENLLFREFFTGKYLRDEFAKKEGFHPPYFMVISPTLRCNLSCYGCYAGEYKINELEFDLVNNLLSQGKELGMFFITISGGEPFSYKKIFDIFESHPDVYFLVYTNGTLINSQVAEILSHLGNVLPCISVEGFKEETEKRRGKGTFGKILSAMENLKNFGVPFGFSVTATRFNNDLIVSDEFVDFYWQRGCLIGWYFQYMPIGRIPDLEMMPTPLQRIHRFERIKQMRKEKSILLSDFWNDGHLVGGCIAGGRSYLHINSNGDVEPCVFVHFALDNVKKKSLVEILKSDFFHRIRSRQPYSPNLLCPCMIIDNPQILREVVSESNAHPSHPSAEKVITDYHKELMDYARQYGELADKIWKRDYLSQEVKI